MAQINQVILLSPLETLDRAAHSFLTRPNQLELWPKALRVERVLEDIRFCVQEAMAHISSAEFTKERNFLLGTTMDQLKVNIDRIIEAMESPSFPLKILLDRGGYGFNLAVTMLRAYEVFFGAVNLYFLEIDSSQEMSVEEQDQIFRRIQTQKRLAGLPPFLRKLLEEGGNPED